MLEKIYFSIRTPGDPSRRRGIERLFGRPGRGCGEINVRRSGEPGLPAGHEHHQRQVGGHPV